MSFKGLFAQTMEEMQNSIVEETEKKLENADNSEEKEEIVETAEKEAQDEAAELAEDITKIINNDEEPASKIEEIQEVVTELKETIDEQKEIEIEEAESATEAMAVFGMIELKAMYANEDLTNPESKYLESMEGVISGAIGTILEFLTGDAKRVINSIVASKKAKKINDNIRTLTAANISDGDISTALKAAEPVQIAFKANRKVTESELTAIAKAFNSSSTASPLNPFSEIKKIWDLDAKNIKAGGSNLADTISDASGYDGNYMEYFKLFANVKVSARVFESILGVVKKFGGAGVAAIGADQMSKAANKELKGVGDAIKQTGNVIAGGAKAAAGSALVGYEFGKAMRQYNSYYGKLKKVILWNIEIAEKASNAAVAALKAKETPANNGGDNQ
jgi:hypothetical protein